MTGTNSCRMNEWRPDADEVNERSWQLDHFEEQGTGDRHQEVLKKLF